MSEYAKKLEEITRAEWVLYEWIPVNEVGGFEGYIRGVTRDPSDAIRAGRDWDEWRKAYDELNQK